MIVRLDGKTSLYPRTWLIRMKNLRAHLLTALFSLSSLYAVMNGMPAGGQGMPDSLYSHSPRFRLREQLVPLGLISGGLAIEAAGVKKSMQDWFPRTETRADDYLRYVPVVMLYGSDILGSRHRSNAFNQTKFLLISVAATGLITQAIKKLTSITRPNGGNLSFPSGHTSEAFAIATVLYNESKDYDPLLAYSGYLFSAATGVLRITNNRHWVSDVLAGAGLGMLVTNLVYFFEPLNNWDPLKLDGKAQITPLIDVSSDTYYVSVIIKLGRNNPGRPETY